MPYGIDRYGIDGNGISAVPVALVGDRDRHDSARLRRFGARWDDDCTDLARSWVLRARADCNS